MYHHKVSRKGSKKGPLAEMQNSKETGGIEGFHVLGFRRRQFFDSWLYDLKLERVVLREVTSRLIPCNSTHPLGHIGPVTESLYIYIYT